MGEEQPNMKLTRFLSDPKHVTEAESPSVLETQANLTNNPQAKLIVYCRLLAKEFEIFNPDGREDKAKVNKPDLAADIYSLTSQGDQARGRNDAVNVLARMGEQKKPLDLENLGTIQIKPPEGQPVKKKVEL